MAHFLQPHQTHPHGPEFAATLLRLSEQFLPASTTWLRSGYKQVGMPVSGEQELEELLQTCGTNDHAIRWQP
jgi:hypothetical protein